MADLDLTWTPDVDLTWTPETEEPKQEQPLKRNAFAYANDTAIEAGNAAAGLVKSGVDLFAPGSDVSKSIEGFIKEGESKQSDWKKDQRQRLAQDIASADGEMNKAGAYLKHAVFEDPLGTGGQILGNVGPFGVAGRGLRMLGAAAETPGSMILAGGLTAGEVRGNIYDRIGSTPDADLIAGSPDYAALRNNGLSEAEAKHQIGSEFLRYAPELAAAGAFGSLGGKYGLEGLATGAGRNFGRVGNAIIGVVDEATQGATEQLASNYAVRRHNPKQSLTEDVALNAAAEGILGLGGAAVGRPDQATAPRVQPATEEDLNASAAEMSGALDAYDALPNDVPRLGFDPNAGVIQVPNSNGGQTTINRDDGPLSAAVVDTGITSDMLANQTMLVPFASRNAAQQQLDQREDGERLQIIPHPRVPGRFAIAPRDRLSLQAMDQAKARQQQVELEDGNAAPVAAPATTTGPTFNGADANTVVSPNGGQAAYHFTTSQGSEYVLTSDGMLIRNKSANHTNTGGMDAGVKDWANGAAFFDAGHVLAPGRESTTFPLTTAALLDQGHQVRINQTEGMVTAQVLDRATNQWRDATLADAFPKSVQHVQGFPGQSLVQAPFSFIPKSGDNVLDFRLNTDGSLRSAHPGSPVAEVSKLGTSQAAANTEANTQALAQENTQAELTPQPAQPVSEMPGVRTQNDERLARARAEAEARGATLIDEEASAANPTPSEAQVAAGNYKKGHVKIGPLDVSVENPVGSTRKGKGWETTMSAHYGYVKRTTGADGDQVDVFIKEGTANDFNGQVYVIDQFNPETGRFDEHKAMVGYANALEAMRAYDAHFSDKSGPKRRQAVTAMPLSEFNNWARNGDTTQALSQKGRDADAAQAEIEQSTGKFSKQRGRTAEQANADRQQRRASLEKTTEATPEATLREVLGEGAQIVTEGAGLSRGVAKNLEQLARLFGKKVVFYTGDAQHEGFYVRGNMVFISADQTSVAQLRLLGHELLHALKAQSPETYDKMLAAVSSILTDAEIRAQYEDYKGKPLEGEITDAIRADMAEEWMADLSGNRFGETAFWESVFNKLEEKHGTSLAKKIINQVRMAVVAAIKKLQTVLNGGKFAVDERVAQHLDQVREALAQGFADYAKAVKDQQVKFGDVTEGTGEVKFARHQAAPKLTKKELKEIAEREATRIFEGKTVEQSNPLDDEQWQEVRRIALQKLKPMQRAAALKAEREYLELQKEADILSEKYKERAAQVMAKVKENGSSSVSIMDGSKPATVEGTGKLVRGKPKVLTIDIGRFFLGRQKKIDISTEEGRKAAGIAMAREAAYALTQDGHAVGWYDRKVREALAISALVHPELLNNKKAQVVFKMIAAITSNGQAVRDNFILANIAYSNFKNGVPLESVLGEGGGARRGAMIKSLIKLRNMIEDHGAERVGEIMLMPLTVKEIQNQFGLKVSGEHMTTVLPAAVGLGGPKIGSFYANLSGHFDSLTMDMWFMRTAGRITGNIVVMPKTVGINLNELASIMPESGEWNGVDVKTLRAEIDAYNKLDEDEQADVETVLETVPETIMYARAQLQKFSAPDAEGKTFTQKTLQNENARRLVSALDSTNDSPGNGAERNNLRGVVDVARGLLSRYGIDLNVADLQAVLWYYEKNLFTKLGANNASAKPWDYASAARFGVGRTLGLVDVKSSRRAGQVGAGEQPVAGGVPAEVQRLGEDAGQVKASPSRVLFEVAPDPNDARLTSAWKSLSTADKLGISKSVATRLIPKILSHFNATGQMSEQIGGYQGESNPSFTILLDSGDPDAIAKASGFVLSQDMMIAVSDKPFPGGVKTGAVTIEIGNADPAAVYAAIYDKVKAAEGHTTVNGQMIILNNPKFGISTDELGRRVDEALGGRYDAFGDDGIYAEFPESKDYGYDIQDAQGTAAGSPDSQWARVLRAEANQQLESELRQRGVKLSPARSDAARNERDGGSNAETGRALAGEGYGTASPGAISVVGRHYSAEQRSSLDGRYYGTGARGKEGPRVRAATDPRIKERIYFYVNSGKGVTPEQGVGSHAHDLRLNNVYDANADTWVQAKMPRDFPDDDAWLNAFEAAVIDNGFDGYVTDFGTQRAAVLLGRHNVQPTYVGLNPAQAPGVAEAKAPEAPAPKNTAADAVEKARTLPMGQMSGADWKKMIPLVVPGADVSMLDNAKTYYKSDVVGAMRGTVARMSLARLTDGRIDRLMSKYAYTMDDKRSKAYLAWVRPQDFLAATTPEGDVARIESEKTPLDKEQLRKEYQEMFLQGEFDPENNWWKTDGHEGRHRMAALRDAGVHKVPVVFYARQGEQRNVITQLYATPQRWGNTKAVEGFFATNLIPINYENLDRIKSEFGGKADVMFSNKRFYSQLERSVEQAPDKVFGSAKQVKNWLVANAGKLGIKQDEVQWSGINEWLDLQQKVSKPEVLDYLAANGVRVEEVEKGKDGYSESNPTLPKDSSLKVIETNEEEHGRSASRYKYVVVDADSDTTKGWGNTEEDAIADAYSGHPEYWDNEAATKYGQYTLPGGENYRELLLTLPEKVSPLQRLAGETLYSYAIRQGWSEEKAEQIRLLANEGDDAAAQIVNQYYGTVDTDAGTNFSSGHWDEPNILAHIRYNDRTDADGNRVLFIEELQSDWAQNGKKKGFALSPQEREESQRQSFDLARRSEELIANVRREGRVPTAEEERQVQALRTQRAALEVRSSSSLPTAPFVTKTEAWVDLALKRMIAYAVENGYDKVAFVNGQQSADRYSLTKQVKQIDVTWFRAERGELNLKATGLNGEKLIDKQAVHKDQLEDYIGKELAQKAEQQLRDHGVARLTDTDMEVGGEGMKAFYDQIVPQRIKDVLKKLGGGQLETVRISTSEDDKFFPSSMWGKQPGFSITPAMREKAEAGLPLFSLRRHINNTLTNLDHAVDGLSNLPNQFDYLKDRYLALGRIARVDEIVKEIRQAFSTKDPANKKAVYNYLTTRGASPSMIPDSEIRAMAERIKKTINYVGDQLVARGLIDQQARDHYRDQYLPRMYLRHMLDDNAAKVMGMGKKPSDLGYIKHRKDIPAEIREVVLGEVKDPAFLSANAIGRAMRDVALLDWMGQISQNNDWTFPEVFVNWQGKKVTAYWLKAEADRIERQADHYEAPAKAKAAQMVSQMRTLANQTLGKMSAIDHKKYKQIPDTMRYGLLRGMWVRQEIFDDIMGAGQIMNADPTWFEDWFGVGGKGTKLTQWWKFTKVALNPPGQIRNFISNMVMLQLSGVGLHKLPILLVRAAKEISSNGRYWQVAKKYGVTESTFTAQELHRVRSDLIELEAQQGKMHSLRWLMAAGARFLEKVSDLYQFSEALGKTIKIIDEMEKGKSEVEAAIEAQKWLFDYSLVPRSVRIARNAPVGMPFLTYQVKVLPRLLEVAAKHPWRFLPWAGLLYGMQAAVASMLGVDGDDLDKLKKSLPQWLQDRGHTVFLPMRDKDGRIQVADVGYFFPWTFYSTAVKHAAEGNMKKLIADDIFGQFSAPIIGAGSALISNYDNFTKRPIYNESDPVAYQAAAIANYSYDLMAPPFLSSHGVVSPMGLLDEKFGGKMVQAMTGSTNRFGDPRATEGQAIGALIGANFYGMDPEHTRITNLQVLNRKILDAERQLKTRLYDRGLTPEERASFVKDYQSRMKDLQEDLLKYAKESEVPEQLRVRK